MYNRNKSKEYFLINSSSHPVIEFHVVKFKTGKITKSWIARAGQTVVATVLVHSLLVAHSASLLRLSFRGCFWNLCNKVMLSKPYDVFLSRDLHVGTISILKQKGCNHLTLKSQEWFLTAIFLINNEAVEH